MQFVRCDICRNEIPETKPPTEMVYSVAISDSEDVFADTKAEKAVLVEYEHVCMPCAKAIRRAIVSMIRVGGQR